MPNYKPKGFETMRKLGRAGGKKSGEVRRQHARERHMLDLIGVWEPCRVELSLEQVEEVTAQGLPNASGGSHDTDWRCPGCHQFHSAKKWFCRRCGRLIRKRTTRKRLRELEAEHRTAGILRKHGLAGVPSESPSDKAPDPVPPRAALRSDDTAPAAASRRPVIGLGAIATLDLDVAADGE
jgi:hypothetical protein